MNDVLKTPKSISTIITLFNIVKSELFITLDHAERNLEMFISEQQSSASLQQFIQSLQQIRGSLELIEIPGATLVTNLIIESASVIPENLGDTHEWDPTLNAITTSILTLRHYLENIDNYPSDLSELLLPTINSLRALTKQPALPDSYFIDIKTSLPNTPFPPVKSFDEALFGRLRQMYQAGLLGLIKDENRKASLRMMTRAIDRLQTSLSNEDAIRLCWVTAAALESFIDSEMSNSAARKKLFSRVDQQLRKIQIDDEAISKPILKDLLYLVALDNVLGTKAFNVFTAFNLTPLPYNYATLDSEVKKLAGPNQAVINSFSEAVCEEISQTKLLIDQFLVKKDENQTDLIVQLLSVLNHLTKTLSMVGFNSTETLLKSQVEILEKNKNETTLPTDILDKLADVILHVESIIFHYESTAFCDNTQPTNSKVYEQEDPLNQYLKQGKDLAIKESKTEIMTAQQYIVGYIESKGDKQYLEKMPAILNEIYGCLLFLNQARAAKVVRQCSYYIEHNLQHLDSLPQNKEFDNLADILASLEYFIETEISTPNIMDSKVLDLAEESLATFNLPDINIPTLKIIPSPSASQKIAPNKEEVPTPSSKVVSHTNEKELSTLLKNNQIIIEDEFDTTEEVSSSPNVIENNDTLESSNFTFSSSLDDDNQIKDDFTLDILSTEKDPFDIEISEPTSNTSSLFNDATTDDTDFSFSQNPSETKFANYTADSDSEQNEPDNITKSFNETFKQVNELKESSPETPPKPNYAGLSLEPIAEQQQEDHKTETVTPVSVSEKKEDDDIKFTRPTNWELL